MKKIMYAMAVVLIAASCKKNTTPINELPTNTTGTENTNANARAAATVQFSGYTWNVRNDSSPGGPGPNLFSGSNSWVDSNGRLHLKISKNATTGQWSCAEIYSTQRFGYGTYQWQIEARIDSLDKNIVLGLFNYSGNHGYDEMDIEIARWGNNAWPNLNYTIWPGQPGYNTWSYTQDVKLNGTYTTHRFTRNSNSVVFRSMHGHVNDNTNQFATATASNSATTNISTLSMPVHMNLWLFDGLAPSNGKEVEIIIHNFKYTPL